MIALSEPTVAEQELERHNCTMCGQKDMVMPRPFIHKCLSRGWEEDCRDFVFPPPIELPEDVELK